MRDIQELFDAVDLAIGHAYGIVPESARARAGEDIRDLRSRRGYLGATLVVAIGGGTGTGKSSLLNAIAGSDVAPVGRLRPTTDQPLAWIPESAAESLSRLLDALGIVDRHRHGRDPGVALVDLPDMDSVAAAHRVVVERLLRKVDALLWVLDPEKYRDPVLHDDFLRPLSIHAAQTVFVFNKLDLIPEAERARVIDDATAALVADGYTPPRLYPIAADPPQGGPLGIEPLVSFLEAELDHKRVAHGKLLADVAGVVKSLADEARVWQGAGVDLSTRWSRARDAALGALDPASPVPTEDARCRVEDLIAAFATELEGEAAIELRSRFAAGEAAAIVNDAERALASGDPVRAREILDERVADAVAVVILPRARFAAAVTYAHIGARQLAAREGVSTW